MGGNSHDASPFAPRRISCGLRATSLHTGRVGRGERGFTAMELMAVVAILAVIAAVVFVAIGAIQRNAQQAELDGTAKEIFVAAQNHLSTADAQGTLARKTDKGQSVPGEEGVYYYAVGDAASKVALDPASNARYTSVLYQMLPFGSIDDTVRVDGTYVIKYDLESATVLGVFYARSSYSSLFAANTDGFEFQDADYALLFPAYEGPGKKEARQNYASASGQTVMVGYYGGDDLDALKGDRLKSPVLKVENAERLTAIVTNPNAGVDIGKVDADRLRPTLKLLVIGETSKAAKQITLVNNGSVDTAAAYVESSDGGKTFYVFLDDVTTRGGHFAEIFGSDGFIPGENIRVQAVAYSSSKLTNVAESTKVHRNSLFASLSGVRPAGSSGTTYSTAQISNIRHLENLSGNVSGYDPTADGWAGKGAKAAVQARDLSWTDFQLAIVKPASGDNSMASAETLAAQAQAASSVRTVELSTWSGPVRDGSFMPVSPSYGISYDGRNHRISDVTVDREFGNVGVFGDLDGSVVRDLVIVNANVRTDSGDAGAFAGALTGASSVSGVMAYDELASGDDSAYQIEGTRSVGGLIGSMSGGSVSTSAAAVYVRSTGGYAGGLIGWVGGTVSVANSYVGGHTQDGKYGTGTDMGVSGRMNVIAAGNAGGLVGNAASAALSIDTCYSTASATGDIAGGLVGYMNGGSISNSYATGLVSAGTQGALVGVSEGAAMSGCRFLEAVNDKVAAVGSGSGSADAADASMGAYAAFAVAAGAAYPYDATLMRLYQGNYPYPTVAALSGASAGATRPLFLAVHYGDWPAVETLVVNP